MLPQVSMSAGARLAIQKLSKSFGAPQRALSEVTLALEPGEMVALIGASGSGKSTLLRHVSGFIGADRGSGEVRVGDHVIQAGGRVDRRIRRLRAEVGFVFQQFNLVGRLTVMTNVLVGLLPRVALWRSLTMRFNREHRAEAWRALRSVGIENLAWQRASTLSGGQQQRVAIARALVTNPAVIFADEPTGNLDSERGHEIMRLLKDLNETHGVTIVLVTHEEDIASYAKRHIRFRDGRIAGDSGRRAA
ncbi:MAG: ATP-binding cassette domain-containing protein [Burkholderiales bacterium]|nr:ATP-binding cassette domain-containing protein [Burkholderiales bacterium]